MIKIENDKISNNKLIKLIVEELFWLLVIFFNHIMLENVGICKIFLSSNLANPKPLDDIFNM